MPVQISGVLKDGAGKPIQNCTIQLKAKRNSTTVIVNTVTSENPDEAGRYAMDVEYGQYSVILLVEGYPPNHAGTITVYEDSEPGTLNDFLGALSEDDVRPEALRRFEQMVEEVSRQAAEVENNAALATEAAREATDSAARSEKNAESAEGAAQRADVSAENSAASAQAASESADNAASDAGGASESAKRAQAAEAAAASSAEQAGKHESNAAASALSASQAEASAAESAWVATDKAEEALNHELEAKSAAQAAKLSETEAARSEANAALSADAAEQSAIKAEESSVQAASSANEVKQNVAEAALHAAAATQKGEEAAASASAAEQNRLASEAAASQAVAAAERAEDIASAVGMEDASLTRKGVVRLSNATDSDSEREASTPRAVKDVMDETRRLNESLAAKQPLNDLLTAISGLVQRTNTLLYFDASENVSLAPLSVKARTILAQATSEDMRSVLELKSAATMEPQTDIRDRTEGRLAIPGMFGFGKIFSGGESVDFKTEADFLSWVKTAPPGRYCVYGGGKIIQGVLFSGIVDIIWPESSPNPNLVYVAKIIIFYGVNGHIYYNRYWTTGNGCLIGWEKLKLGISDLIAPLYSTTGNSWGSPDVGGLIFAAYFGESDTDNNRKMKRGQVVAGSRLGAVTISAKGSATGSYASTPQFITVSPNSYPQAGAFTALSGSHLTTLGTSECFVGLFIRVG